MKMMKRKEGSQRMSKPVECKLFPNFAGQGGDPQLTLQTTDGDWIWFEFDNADEVRELLSQAHIVHHNFPEQKA